MPPRQLRLGIVGCGEVVQICHLPSLALLPSHFQVAALCDVSRYVLNAVGERLPGAAHFLDYRELVRRPDVDAVLVANPQTYHGEVTCAALEAGKHVLVEKPMCLTLREADAIIEAQQRTGLTVQVGTMRRYAPAFLAASYLVKELGEIRFARVHDLIGRNALITSQTASVARGEDVSEEVLAAGRALQQRLIAEAIGPANLDERNAFLLLLGLATHDTSAMRELLGRPQGVLYAAQRHGGRYLSAAFDYGDFVCQFETGVDEVPRFDGHLEVYGADRVIRIQYDTPYVHNLPVRLNVTAANGQGGVEERMIQPTGGDPFVEEWRAFYRHVTDGEAPKTSPADFREDLELFLDMMRLIRHASELAAI